MTEMVPVTISAVVRSSDEGPGRGERFFIELAETAGSRRLYIGVGDAEATALASSLQGTEFPRPMTYKFAAALLAASGSGVREVRVTGVAEGIFYAQVVLVSGAVVDARPSDAINLAAVTSAPVYVASELLSSETAPARRIEALYSLMPFVGI
jgi:bifunctional DNase/RNase